MKDSFDVIKAMVRTEKGSSMLPLNKYLFWVDKAANKIEVKKAVKDIYKVTPSKINVINVKGKWKRVRYHEGKTSGWKKVIVTLKSGEKIDIT